MPAGCSRTLANSVRSPDVKTRSRPPVYERRKRAGGRPIPPISSTGFLNKQVGEGRPRSLRFGDQSLLFDLRITRSFSFVLVIKEKMLALRILLLFILLVGSLFTPSEAYKDFLPRRVLREVVSAGSHEEAIRTHPPRPRFYRPGKRDVEAFKAPGSTEEFRDWGNHHG
ncbi:hypothetical protein M3Y99_00913000 [Aphelenchoides fujianensis]|nr:hypothetical protein M3Y99_00913000 [Aphelenchoides fujianensis]